MQCPGRRIFLLLENTQYPKFLAKNDFIVLL